MIAGAASDRERMKPQFLSSIIKEIKANSLYYFSFQYIILILKGKIYFPAETHKEGLHV